MGCGGTALGGVTGISTTLYNAYNMQTLNKITVLEATTTGIMDSCIGFIVDSLSPIIIPAGDMLFLN